VNATTPEEVLDGPQLARPAGRRHTQTHSGAQTHEGHDTRSTLERKETMMSELREPGFRPQSQGPATLRKNLIERTCLLPRTFGDGITTVVAQYGQYYIDQLDAAERFYGRTLAADEQKLLDTYLANRGTGDAA